MTRRSQRWKLGTVCVRIYVRDLRPFNMRVYRSGIVTFYWGHWPILAKDSNASSKKPPSVHFSDLISSPYIALHAPKPLKRKLEDTVGAFSKWKADMSRYIRVHLHAASRLLCCQQLSIEEWEMVVISHYWAVTGALPRFGIYWLKVVHFMKFLVCFSLHNCHLWARLKIATVCQSYYVFSIRRAIGRL